MMDINADSALFSFQKICVFILYSLYFVLSIHYLYLDNVDKQSIYHRSPYHEEQSIYHESRISQARN